MDDEQPWGGPQDQRSSVWPGEGRPGRSPEIALDPCQEAIATLYTFLDGELTADRRRQIQHHIEECGPCLQAFDFEADLKALIARKCRDEVPESLRRRVADALRAEDVPS